MKFLFFDVECSNTHNGLGKLCEFGYVLTDENFHVLDKDDIPMSPGRAKWAAFDLTGRKNDKDIVLAYDYDYYYSQPAFPRFYNRIRDLMCDQDTICFAYSMQNDIRHINCTCERYKKEPLNYDCYDIQMLVSKFLNRKGQMNLEAACLEIVGQNSLVGLQKHLSRDDAMMTMMIFEAICFMQKEKPLKVLEESAFAKTNSIAFVKKIRERAKEKKLRAEGHALYKTLVAPEEELDKKENIGRRYNISNEIKGKPSVLRAVIDLVNKKNGIFSNHLPKTDFFIVYDEENKNIWLERFDGQFQGQIIAYQEFCEIK